MECSICCENYNQSTFKKVTCPYSDCNFSACKNCVRTYVLGTSADPNCMNCKKEWNDKFLSSNLNKTFVEKDYKKHRKKFLLEREVSRLPESMNAAEKQKRINVEEEKEKNIRLKIIELNNILVKLKRESGAIRGTIYKIRHGSDNENTRRKFIMACPNNNCRGYLSTQYKCDLCELFTCPDCLEIIGYSREVPHICDPNSVASAQMIKKDTKPCPQCGVRIFKIQGCNQMWCTQCKIAFDYATLKIDTGVVHNPHYYQHLQEGGNGVAPRNPQDVLCGGLCSIDNINHLIHNYLPVNTFKETFKHESYTDFINCILKIHRVISHFTYYELPRVRQAVRVIGDTEKYRVYYILGEKDGEPYTKENLSNHIYVSDKSRKKHNCILHIYELISVVGIETFKKFIDERNNFTNSGEYITMIYNKLSELNSLKNYCNNEFAKISNTYNSKIIYIDYDWSIKTKKYNLTEVKED